LNLRRIARWVAALISLCAASLLIWKTIRFIPAYVTDKSQVDQAGYLGTITGCIGLLVIVFQFLAWLRRRKDPDETAVALRSKTAEDLDRRLHDMSRTPEDIALTYRKFADGEKISRNDLVDELSADSARLVVVVGQPGVGKSYTALQVAAALIRQDAAVVPLVIPLSRWAEVRDPTSELIRFLAEEFDVGAPSADALFRTGKIVPIFDGLDELCREAHIAQPAADLLKKLIDWRVLGDRVSFLLTCRRSTWNMIDPRLTRHQSLSVFSIMAVGREQAFEYLINSAGGADGSQSVESLMTALQNKGRGEILTSPWQLSLLAEIVENRLNQTDTNSSTDLRSIADFATRDNLIAYHIESSRLENKWLPGRIRQSVDYWWLSNYARYLEKNRLNKRTLAYLPLPTRDLVPHRLWPAAGKRAPRLIDLAMCIILSVPGFYWVGTFMWRHGPLAWAVLVIFGAAWTYLMVRTSLKPWVRPARPNWGKLSEPKFFVRQFAAAVLIAAVAEWIIGPLAALVCFVTAWLCIGLTVGFGQTLVTNSEPRVIGPFGVLQRERQVSRFSALAAFPVLAAGFSVTWGDRTGVTAALIYCLVVGETVACALWRRYLAMIVASRLRLPPAPGRCFERMHSLGHLRIAGMSYQFRHDDILRYFAQREGLRLRRAEHPIFLE
jgi:NACHT domain